MLEQAIYESVHKRDGSNAGKQCTAFAPGSHSPDLASQDYPVGCHLLFRSLLSSSFVPLLFSHSLAARVSENTSIVGPPGQAPWWLTGPLHQQLDFFYGYWSPPKTSSVPKRTVSKFLWPTFCVFVSFLMGDGVCGLHLFRGLNIPSGIYLSSKRVKGATRETPPNDTSHQNKSPPETLLRYPSHHLYHTNIHF